MKKPQLHVTGLEMLSKCGELFRRVYIEKERKPPGVYVVVGKSTHRSVERDLRHKIEHRELLSLEEIQDTARDALVREWQHSDISLEPEELELGLQVVREQAIDKAVRLASLHHMDMAPQVEPVSVEHEWTIELPGYPMDLAGTIDILEAGAVRDTKTSKKTPNERVAHESLQLTAYALAVKVIDKVEVGQVCLDYLIDTKTPQAKTYSSTRDADDYRVLLARIETATLAIQKGIFVPARESDWWCSAKWCGFYSTCRYVRRPKQFAAA